MLTEMGKTFTLLIYDGKRETKKKREKKKEVLSLFFSLSVEVNIKVVIYSSSFFFLHALFHYISLSGNKKDKRFLLYSSLFIKVHKE
jgi:hypothetical protein